MRDEYKVIRVDVTNDLEAALQAAADEGFDWVDSLTSRTGAPVVVMKKQHKRPPG
jgi:hypothetical protein